VKKNLPGFVKETKVLFKLNLHSSLPKRQKYFNGIKLYAYVYICKLQYLFSRNYFRNVFRGKSRGCV